MVYTFSDIAGTLYFDFSVDGTNWHVYPTAGFKVSASIPEFHTAVKGPRYFRTRFVMDAGTQTVLRLNTYYGENFVTSVSPLNQAIGIDSDAIVTRIINPQHEVRLGFRSGVAGWNLFGYRTGLTAAGGEEMVWATTGNYVPPTAAATMTITYDGTGGGSTDGAGTTGATELTIWYIDSAGLPAILTHTLGTDGSDETVVTGLGINRVAVSASGSEDHNVSAITVTATGGGKLATVPALGSVTQQAIFHVGSNHTVIADYLYINLVSSAKTPTVLIKGYVYNRGVDTTYEVFRTNLDTSTELTQTIQDPVGFVLNPTDVLYFVADTSANSVDISIRVSLNEYQRS